MSNSGRLQFLRQQAQHRIGGYRSEERFCPNCRRASNHLVFFWGDVEDDFVKNKTRDRLIICCLCEREEDLQATLQQRVAAVRRQVETGRAIRKDGEG